MKTLLIFCLSLLTFSCTFSQRVYTKKEFKTDYSYFKQLIKKRQKAIYPHLDTVKYWTVAQNKYQSILSQDSISHKDMLRFYLELISSLRDVHSFIPYNHLSSYIHRNNQYTFKHNIIPKPDGSFQYMNSYDSTVKKPYIHSIDGIPIDSIFNDFKKYVSLEIITEENYKHEIARNFNFFMSAFFDFKDKNKCELKLSVTPNGSTYIQTEALHSLKNQKIVKQSLDFFYPIYQWQQRNHILDLYTVEEFDGNYGLYMPYFNIAYHKHNRYNKNMTRILNYYLSQNVDTLIIDLRSNIGGFGGLALMFSQQFTNDTLSTKAFDIIDDSLTTKCNSQNPFWHIRDSTKAFKKIYVYINKYTVSAGIIAAFHLQTMDNVELIGQSPSSRINTSGDSHHFRLPSSLIRISLPNYKANLSDDYNATLTPDIYYNWDLENFYDHSKWGGHNYFKSYLLNILSKQGK